MPPPRSEILRCGARPSMSVLHGGDGRLVWELFTTALQFPTRSGTRRGARAKVVWTLQALLAVPVGMPWASTYVVTNIVTSDTTCGGRAHFTRACSMFRFWFVSACGVAIRVGTQKKCLRPACVVQLAPQAGALRGTIANPGCVRTTPFFPPTPQDHTGGDVLVASTRCRYTP